MSDNDHHTAAFVFGGHRSHEETLDLRRRVFDRCMQLKAERERKAATKAAAAARRAAVAARRADRERRAAEQRAAP